jgi:hypothetical protein
MTRFTQEQQTGGSSVQMIFSLAIVGIAFWQKVVAVPEERFSLVSHAAILDMAPMDFLNGDDR